MTAKRMALCCLLFLLPFVATTQVVYETIDSKTLGEKRSIKIQLPRSYNQDTKQEYPIVVVFDGDYLFEPVAGNVDYLSYWGEIPEAIVVGVLQSNSRIHDGLYGRESNFPEESGARFFEFVGTELLAGIAKNYRVAPYTVAVGHEFTANFINYYLFKNQPLFNAYICLSPEPAPTMESLVPTRLAEMQQLVSYYLATGTEDTKYNRNKALEMDKALTAIKRPGFTYAFDEFVGAGHYALVSKAVPNGLLTVFSHGRAITKNEYDKVLLKLETPLVDFLTHRYDKVEKHYGFRPSYRANDLIAVATAAEKKKHWDQLEAIARLAKKELPNTLLGDYYLGRYYEETGDYRKAIRTYQGARMKESVGFITMQLLLDRADQIKIDFGY